MLADPLWRSLTEGHAHLALGAGRARRYPPSVAAFAALADPADPAAWADLATLVGPADAVALVGPSLTVPGDWEQVIVFDGLQMVATEAFAPAADAEAIELGVDDVPEMTALVDRTKPGPWAPETYRMGRYIGLRRDGALIAMAGERMHPAGWTEISAVCVDDGFRGQGLAARLVRAVGAGIADRGEQAFLHALASNAGAIRLYEWLGFAVSTLMTFAVVRPRSADNHESVEAAQHEGVPLLRLHEA